MTLINRSVLNVVLAGVLGSVSATALAEPASAFRAHDSNGDAKISLEEFQARGGEERAFRQGDADRDNKLTRNSSPRPLPTTTARMAASPSTTRGLLPG